jgi:hypothetical protein
MAWHGDNSRDRVSPAAVQDIEFELDQWIKRVFDFVAAAAQSFGAQPLLAAE